MLQEKNMQDEKIKIHPKLLEVGEIEVWQVRGTPDASLLSPEEMLRFKDMPGEPGRTNFLLSRCAIRSILEQYTEVPAHETRIDIHPGGKPFFVNYPSLHFSLSHSGSEVAVAFSRWPVGFDLEINARRADFLAVAHRFFTLEEAAKVAAAGEGMGPLFVELWTAKEAMLKLEGSGISGGLERALVRSGSHGELDGRHVHLHRLEWPGLVAQVASFEKPLAVRMRELIFR